MISRRTVLTALGAGLVLPALPAAARQTRQAGTLHRQLSLSGRGGLVEATPFPLSHLGVAWSDSGEVTARLRVGRVWGDWHPVTDCGHRPDHAPPARRAALLVTPGLTGYEVRSTGGGDLVVTELNTVDPPVRTSTTMVFGMRVGTTMIDIPFVSRAAWGADESLRFTASGSEIWPPEYFAVQALTVHHTAGQNGDPDPAATVRAIYHYDAAVLGWGDLGYHLMIDEAGRVYEGRWSGADATPVFGPDGTSAVNAGHVLNYNAGNIGVCLLGDFTGGPPTPAAYQALTTVLAALARQTAVNPQAVITYVNPISGAVKQVPTIPGHRDWAATQCPGNSFYPQLPALRTDVANAPA